ncbi:MAG TPA: hypothetical protein VJ327_02270, partial [Patescibacteria group bacterium]|nr:hypothetical protein [Patescibacteria group bacterium]
MTESRLRFGFTPLFILLALALTGSLAIGGYSLVQSPSVSQFLGVSSLSHQLKSSSAFLDQYKLTSSRVLVPAVGTVSLPDGSFSAYRVIAATVNTSPKSPIPSYQDETKIIYPSGDISIDPPINGQLPNFRLKDGTSTPARVLDHLSVGLALPSGRTLPLKILSGRVRDGKLSGDFIAQTYSSGHIVAGHIDDSGYISTVTTSLGSSKTTEAQSIISRMALALHYQLSQSTTTHVLGVTSDQASPAFNENGDLEGPLPLFNPEKLTWTFGTGTATSTSTIANIFTFIQDQVDSGKINVVAPSVNIDAIEDIKSTNSHLTVSIADNTATLSLNLQNSINSESIIDGQVKRADIEDGAVNTTKIENSTITNEDISDAASIAGSKIQLRSGGGIINSSGLTLLTTCANTEVLKWNTTSSVWECGTGSSGDGLWQLNSGAISPFSLTTDVNLGAASTSSAKISLAGSLTRGLAAAIINQTESQDIFTASASGTTRFVIDNSGNIDAAGTLQAGSGNITLTDSTGYVLHDALTDCSNTQILKWSSGGSRWECASDNTGGAGAWTEGSTVIYPTTATNRVGIGTTTEANIISYLYVTNANVTGKAVAIFNQTESQDIFTASASGATRLVLTNAGLVQVIAGQGLDVLAAGELKLG